MVDLNKVLAEAKAYQETEAYRQSVQASREEAAMATEQSGLQELAKVFEELDL